VHRGAAETWDESADLVTLSRTPVLVVCAGVKSILDVAATLERLETLNVGVIGYGTDSFPGFYLSDSGFALDWRVDSPREVAQVMSVRRELQLESALVVANPLPASEALDPELHDRVLESGLTAAARARTSPPSCSTTSTARRMARAWRPTSGSSCATPSSRLRSPSPTSR
jgi:pseudouridine-5'-phosphate glycosidase